MKIGIAQLNCRVGDIAYNTEKIIDYSERAKKLGADLLLTPELSISGYPPEDLLLRDEFCERCAIALSEIATRIAGITVVVGHPFSQKNKRYNAASIISNGEILGTYLKQILPNYTVFDEERYFSAGQEPFVFSIKGVKIGINICEDVWESGLNSSNTEINSTRERISPLQASFDGGAEVVAVINASPFHLGKQNLRYDVVRDSVHRINLPVVFCNMVGGQDELVFDGQSFVMNSRGEITNVFPSFKEELGLINFDSQNQPIVGEISSDLDVNASAYGALSLGVSDYLGKGQFKGALIGLSGGIDSALTACIAADALGSDRVHAVMMPSEYTAGMSIDDSRALVRALGIKYSEIPIGNVFEAFKATLSDQFKGLDSDVTEENLQARIRGTLLMALSNKFGSIVLTTGNKSEMSTGYATLYGDMAGGFSVLKDLKKNMVYDLARYRNTLSPVIPERIISRPPSAELRPDQLDKDSLPDYDILDRIVELYVEQNKSASQMINEGLPEADVRQIVKLVDASEYKRRQAPIGIRITERGFGKDWRYPITNGFR